LLDLGVDINLKIEINGLHFVIHMKEGILLLLSTSSIMEQVIKKESMVVAIYIGQPDMVILVLSNIFSIME